MPGTHSRSIASIVINDTTSTGPLWDPILSAFYYGYNSSSSLEDRFTSADPSTPISWLSYLGRWGDKQYHDNDTRQINFLNLNVTWKYESGPTGPLDKDLNRAEVCPENGKKCTISSILPPTSGSSLSSTVSRPTTSSSATSDVATTITSAVTPATSIASSNTATINIAEKSEACFYFIESVMFIIVLLSSL